jgi:hypothetical protein
MVRDTQKISTVYLYQIGLLELNGGIISDQACPLAAEIVIPQLSARGGARKTLKR